MSETPKHVRLVAVDPDDESAMIAACLAGDAGAQRRLFRREYPRIFATVSRMIGSSRDVDDLVQETFISAFQALPSFRREAKLATWLDRIAVNVVLQYLRSRKHQPVALHAVEGPPSLTGLAEQADAREGLRRLYAALDKLTPGSRMAFALYSIDGRSIADVARVMGTTTIAAKLRIWRARRDIDKRADADPVLADFLASHRRKQS
jgi:RNA polymerase sigma-70 factor (ECF subfamily)